MVAFTVHEPPEPPSERLDRADALVFVREGFSLTAFVFAPLWLLAKKMWLVLAAYVALLVLLAVAGKLIGLAGPWPGLGIAVLHVLIGFEGDSLQRWTLDRAGWRNLGAVTGRTLVDCERSFYNAWLPSQPMIAPRAAGAPSLGALAHPRV